MKLEKNRRSGLMVLSAGLIAGGLALSQTSEAGVKGQRGGSQGGRAGATILPQERPGEPLRNLTPTQHALFIEGKASYLRDLPVAEGLGPIFNKPSCGNCHNAPVGGPGSQTVTRFGQDNKGVFDPLDALGGSLLQVSAISAPCLEFVPPEANHTSLRVTNGSLAFGLVEAIPDAALLANEISPPGGVSGRAHMVGAFEDPPMSPLHVGRMGWKAQVATTLTFSADAGQNELGLSNRFVPFDNAPNGNAALLASCDTVADPEDGPDVNGRHFIDRVTNFQRYLAPPPQTPRSGMSGEVIFNSIGCNNCHMQTFTTSNAPAEAALQNKVIHPYSDFLLHDMGLLGDGVPQGDATGTEMRTPALWGLRTRDPMLHDGRVGAGTFESRVVAAVGWHNVFGSEAQPSGAAFAALSPADKSKVVAFLDSLGRIEFDSNGDAVVNVFDLTAFRGCYLGGAYNADHACAVSDIDQDGDVDSADLDSFLYAWDGLRADCNGNGIMDIYDIVVGTSVDADFDAIPDSCEPTCAADTNGTGTIDIDDLTAVILGWGSCPAIPAPCAGDLDGDDDIDIDDLTQIILGWGNCP